MSETSQIRYKQPAWVTLAILLIGSVYLMLHNWVLMKEYTDVLPRQTWTFGTIYAEHRGRSHSVSYSFMYEGKKFYGQQGTSGALFETVKVFFDSDDPFSNSLTEYSVKVRQDSRMVTIFGLASIVLALILAGVLALNL